MVESRKSMVNSPGSMRDGFPKMSFRGEIGLFQTTKEGKNSRGNGSSISKSKAS